MLYILSAYMYLKWLKKLIINIIMGL
jgi:hypothetical protein